MTRSRPPTIVVTIGCTLLAAGLVAALWTHEWRLAVTGLILFLLCGVISGATRRDQP